MTKELVPSEIKYVAFDKQEVVLSYEIVKKLLVHGKSDLVSLPEASFFMEMCKARGLNPYKKDCYLIKYGQEPASIIVSIDYYRTRAYAQENCQGWQVGVIVKAQTGEVKRTNGLVLEGEELLGAWFKAQPKGWNVLREHEVNLKGYLQYTKEGNLTKFWQKEKQPTQIMKVAEAQGLRSVWPAEFGKLYIREEMYEVPEDTNGNYQPEKATISIENLKPKKEEEIIETAKEIFDAEKVKSTEEEKPQVSLEELRNRIKSACMKLAEKGDRTAASIYHDFADIIKGEIGDEGASIDKIVAPAIGKLSIGQARVTWGKIKEYFKQEGRDVKQELGIV